MMARTKRPAPPHAGAMTQDRQRERRRGWLRVHYTGSFSLTDEVLALTDELAERVSNQAAPRAYRDEVDAVVAAVHALAGDVAGLLAERDARRKTLHLGPGNRPRAAQMLVGLAARPTLPQITESHLANGTWPALLTNLVRPYATPLADHLATAPPPDSPALRGALSSSEHLEAALREIDRQATRLRKRLDSAPFRRVASAPPRKHQSAADAARAELQQLGIEA